MSKRDYELIAQIIREMDNCDGASEALARKFAYAFRERNRAFNIDKFLAACKRKESV